MSIEKPFRIKKSALFSPPKDAAGVLVAAALTITGEVAYDGIDNVLKVRNASTTDSLIQAAAVQTLSNKTFSTITTFSGNDVTSFPYFDASKALVSKTAAEMLILLGAVAGPVSSTDNALVRFDGTTGKLIQNSNVTMNDDGHIVGSNAVTGNFISLTKATTGDGTLIKGTISGQGLTTGLYGIDVTATGNQSNWVTVAGLYGKANGTAASNAGAVLAGIASEVSNSAVMGNSSEMYGAFINLANTSTARAVIGVSVTTNNSGTMESYSGLTVSAAPGTVSGTNHAITVSSGRTYLGGDLLLNARTADTFAYINSSKLVVSKTATASTALLNAMVGDAGLGGTKGLVPAPGAGDAAASKFLKADGTWAIVNTTGDVAGPGSSTDNAITRFDGATGKLIQNSTVTMNDDGHISGSNAVVGNYISLTKTGTFSGRSSLFNGTISGKETGFNGMYGVDVTSTASVSDWTVNSAGFFSANNTAATTNANATLAGIGAFVTSSANTTTSSQIHGILARTDVSGAASIGDVRGITIDLPQNASGTINKYAGLRIEGVAPGTVTGTNEAIRVDAGNSYFGGKITLATENVLELQDLSGGEYVRIKAPATVSASYTLNLPVAQGGASTVLTNDGSGNLTWAAGGGGGANTALSNLASVAINTSLLPGTDNTIDLGSTAKRYSTLYASYVSDSFGNLSVLLEDKILYSTSSDTTSIDWNNKQLYGSTLPILDWASDSILVKSPLKLEDPGGSNTVTLLAPTLSASYTLTLPVDDGTSGQVLSTNGSGVLSWISAGGGSGDVVGPASSVDSTIPVFDGITGKLLKTSILSVDANDNFRVTNTTTGAAINVEKIASSSILGISTYTEATGNPGGGQSTGGDFYGTYSGAGTIGNILGVQSGLGNDAGTAGKLIAYAISDMYNNGTITTEASAISIPEITANSGTLQNYAGLRIKGVSNGTVTDFNDAIHVDAGDSYFGGKITIAAQNPLELQDSTGGEYVRIRANAATTSHTLTMPAAQGAASTVLTNDGSGNLSWAAGGGGGPTVVTPGAYPHSAANNTIILVDSSSARTINLPAPTVSYNITIKDAAGQAATNNITVARNASESIEGVAASYLIQGNWVSITLVSDGTNWFIIG